jgi:hypothetical protein
MFDREDNIAEPMKILAAYLESNRSSYQSFRRRAVILFSNNIWTLMGCSVEAIFSDFEQVEAVVTKCYPKAVLFEDKLTNQELLEFVTNVGKGHINLGEYSLEATNINRNWTRERVPLSNNSMLRSGHVWSTRFDDANVHSYDALLAPQQPYYPDIFEAVKHWLPVPEYQGNSNPRKGEVILLLPETRAFLADATSNGKIMNVRIAGTKIEQLSMELKGAWWDEEGIHHFQERIAYDQVQLNVPESANRLEYVLSDSEGTIYDYQSEDEYRHTGLGRKRMVIGDLSLVNIVLDACRNGEGLRVEFKPFVDLEHVKLKEIIRTVVAFGNTQGGRIFLGIKDDCGLLGIDEQLAKWVEGEANEASCESYLGAIRGKIRDEVHGDLMLNFKQIVVDDRRIAIIEVSPAKEKPISIRQDMNLYIRRGSSNSKASPDEWKAIIGIQEGHFPFVRKLKS